MLRNGFNFVVVEINTELLVADITNERKCKAVIDKAERLPYVFSSFHRHEGIPIRFALPYKIYKCELYHSVESMRAR